MSRSTRKWVLATFRLQVQTKTGIGVDRSINFVKADTPGSVRVLLRGVIFEADDKLDARWKFRDLRKAAKAAVLAGETALFLDELDRRAEAETAVCPTLERFVEDDWKPNCVLGGGLRESQIESDLSILKNHIVPFFGSAELVDITPRDVHRFIATKRGQIHQYKRTYRPKTINNHLSVLHRIFETAIEYELVERNPVRKNAWLKSESTSEDSENWWTPDDEAAAIAVLAIWKTSEPTARLAILTQVVTGIRFSELRALEKRDLDLKTPGLWIRRSMARKTIGTPKNKRARFQVIPRGLADELHEWMLRTEGQVLFPGKKGNRMANNSINRAYRKLAEEAGVRPISSHGARHTTGSSYAFDGANQKMIATLLGHTHTGSTERYTHLRVAETQPLVEARWARLTAAREPA